MNTELSSSAAVPQDADARRTHGHPLRRGDLVANGLSDFGERPDA